MKTYAPIPGRACAAVLALSLAACADGAGITAPTLAPPAPVATITCQASVADGRVQCADAATGARADRNLGGQGLYVRIQSSNVLYDSGTGRFAFDLTMQNLLPQRMGSDGTTVTGVKIFFTSAPTTTGGSGVVSMGNADGMGTFTSTNQPYYFYADALPPQATTPTRRWELEVPPTVQTFSFTLAVNTELVPTIVFDMWPGNDRDVYRMGIDGNDLLKLSTSALTDGSPTTAAGKVVFTSYRNGNAELYTVPITGGAETRLTTSAGTDETAPALSPDGTKLAWAAGPVGGLTKVWAGSVNVAPGGGSWSIGGAAQAVPGMADAIQGSPNWADATTLAFTMAAASSADIWKVVPGNAPTLLVNGSTADVEAAWSPDSTRIAFASNRSGDTELYLYAVGTGAITRLTTRTGSDGGPTWLKDGRIVFTCVTGIQFRLCMVDPANPGTITTLPTPYQAEHASAVRF